MTRMTKMTVSGGGGYLFHFFLFFWEKIKNRFLYDYPISYLSVILSFVSIVGKWFGNIYPPL